MADKNKKGNPKNEDLYQLISYDLQKVKDELATELKVSAVQIASMYEGVKNANASATSAIAQEIRYGYKQNQNIYEGIATLVKTEVADKVTSMEETVSSLEQINTVLNQISELEYNYTQLQALYEGVAAMMANDMTPQVQALAEKLAVLDSMQETLKGLSEMLAENAGCQQSAEAVDYERITNQVGEKVLGLLDNVKCEAPAIDYERVAGDTSAKVVESLPHTEAIDYNRINEMIMAAVASAVNVDAIASAVAAKIEMPTVEVQKEEVDYDKLADLVVEKLAAKGMSADIILDDEGLDKIAETVAEKIGTVDNIDYDKVCLAAQAAQVVPDPVDYDRVAEIVEDKLNKSCDTIERVVMLNEEGVQRIVDGVAEELRGMTLVCEYEEMPEAEEVVAEEPAVEETVEEPAEEPVVEEVAVEEPAEEPVAEEVAVEEPAVEEAVEEPAEEPVAEEIASASAEPMFEEGLDGELIDAETGLVVRLKRSFIAKMKQSDEKVKAYYSDLKNELTSYKRINSNVSWHGDRFNFGRDTVAKIGINGKTLCFYLALDPNDPELKQTVYHQKDVGAQKAYESTPFMVKVKSDAASKKALRLIVILAEKLGTEKDPKAENVDYTAEFAYESTKSLFEAGYIKATKEKKVDFNF